MSIDGFIAGPDDDLGVLSVVEKEGEGLRIFRIPKIC